MELRGVKSLRLEAKPCSWWKGREETRKVPGVQGGQTELEFAHPARPHPRARAGEGSDIYKWFQTALHKSFLQQTSPPHLPKLLSSTSCSSQMLWPKGFSRLRAAAGPARKNVLFSSYWGKALPTFLFLMLSNAFHLLGVFCFLCLWYRRGLLMLFCMQLMGRLLNI